MAEEASFPKTVAMWFYTILLILGVLMYVGWGIFFGTWDPFQPENTGVYAITVVLVGFGIVGILLYSK